MRGGECSYPVVQLATWNVTEDRLYHGQMRLAAC